MVRGFVYEYFQRACRRERREPAGEAGELCRGADETNARFWLRTGDDFRIIAADYRCTTCMTLVAACERLAELVIGLAPNEAAYWTAERLLEQHPGVPPGRHSRATLAVGALQSAVMKLRNGARL